MKKWLIEDEPNHPPEWKLYHKRIQDMVNKKLEMALWLAKNRPDVFLNAVVGTIRMDEPRHKRFQDLLLILQILKPEYEIIVELTNEADNFIFE